MALSKKHVEDVCYLKGGSLKCRYYDEDFNDNGHLINICKKLSPDRAVIDSEIISFLNDIKRSGKDINDQTVPLGDNCHGFIVLKSKLQGYDIK